MLPPHMRIKIERRFDLFAPPTPEAGVPVKLVSCPVELAQDPNVWRKEI
jgi:hypothetical protein